ncbi:MAG TPA: HDIG domain-containing protein [Candidatus Atribacteria bacterium]|nr:HDIG domain-containing protein [Candidatus Atribacteria bacterium]
MEKPTREDAWKLLKEFTKSENLIRHALAVEGAMIGYAEKYGEDIEKWRIIGLIHDFDYEKYPDSHPISGEKILRERGWPEDIIYAIQGHASRPEFPRIHLVDKVLFAVDELAGFIIAAILVRPTRDFTGLKAKSIKKKLKDKAFARKVNREEIIQGAEELGIPLDEHISNMIEILRKREEELNKEGLSLLPKK